MSDDLTVLEAEFPAYDMTPRQALTGLCESLAGQDIATVGMTLTRRAGVLFPAAHITVGYACGLFWWRSGRLRHGRPVYVIHPASDPDGAARRIARLHPRSTWTAPQHRIAGCEPAVSGDV